MSELEERVWENPLFHDELSKLKQAWLQTELGIERSSHLSDFEIGRCVQAAAILAGSDDPNRQRAAFSTAACAADLRGQELPGLEGALRIILTRLGNFPALGTRDSVQNFHRLPTSVAISEERRRLSNEIRAGGKEITLTDFQRTLWRFLVAGRNVAISAPTSAGKSFVLQAYLRELAGQKDPMSACYIVPSRALISQVTDSIAKWRSEDQLSELSLINVPVTDEIDLPKNAIYVLTQERAQAIFQNHPDFSPQIIICDEAQSIQEGARGILLHNIVDGLRSRRPDAQLIFAGPNIGNLSVFREIFDLVHLEEVQSRSPSVLQNLIVVNTRIPIKGRLQLETFSPEKREALGTIDITRVLPSIRERLVRVAERFGQTKPSIVYANRPSDAEAVAIGLTQVFSDSEPSDRLKELAHFVRYAVHKDYDLADCILKRVGFHYGRIPALVRRGVESAFSDGEIKFLVTTSTLIQGVNFPAGNLFVCQPKKGNRTPMNSGEFWNLAGRAGRMGKEFQGNIFLIDYDTWESPLANETNEIQVESFLQTTLNQNVDELESCANEIDPAAETGTRADLEAALTRLLSDHMSGRLSATLIKYGVSAEDQIRLEKALANARTRIHLPTKLISSCPTVSAIRQQRLADYFTSEIKGGGIPRLEELLPRHPRDPDAYKSLSEIYRVCHEQILTFVFPKYHLRMAAISLKWMRGEPLPEIIDENHRRSGGDLASNIRETLNDIEQEIRFKYLRLTSCYIAILAHVLVESGHGDYAKGISALPTYLEVGASDQTMISFISLGLSRLTARILTDLLMDKEMGPADALSWLRTLDLERSISSSIVRADIQRVLENIVAG